MNIRTKRWTRSPRGVFLGVATVLAEWRGFPVDLTRILVVMLFITTAFFPCLLAYIAIALILPEQTSEDIVRENHHYESSSSYYYRREREEEGIKRR